MSRIRPDRAGTLPRLQRVQRRVGRGRCRARLSRSCWTSIARCGRLLGAGFDQLRRFAPRGRARRREPSGRSRALDCRSPRRSTRASSMISAAAVNSPASMWLLARKLSANCRCASAPVSRASCTWRAASRCSASSSHISSATMLLFLPLRKREPPAHILVGDVRREQELESPSECRRRGRVSVGQADRERVEQHVDRPRRNGAGWRRPRGGRDRRRAAGHLDVAGHGAPERLEVRLASQLGVERLEAASPRSETGGRRRRRAAAPTRSGLARGRPARARARRALRPRRRPAARAQPSRSPASRFAPAAASRRCARCVGSGVSAAARSRKAATAANPPRACARPAERSSSAATSSSGMDAACARCHARRSGSISGSVASARARWTARRSFSPAAR